VNLFFLDHPEISGIFNVGTGQGETFNAVAHATINAVRKGRGEPELTLDEMRDQAVIEYIPFPQQLMGKYQSYTQADTTALRGAGYEAAFLTVGEGVERYVTARMKSGEAA
jgi:ADP-L-glycero-D-manno-heptose 6-epimerase